MMKSIVYFTILILTLSTTCLAQEIKLENISLTFGTLSENLNNTQTKVNQKPELFSSFNPYIGLGTEISYFKTFNIELDLNYVIRRTALNPQIKKDQFLISFSATNAFKFNPHLKWHLGTTTSILSIFATGGADNDQSGTEYYLPDERRISLTQSLDIGLEYIIDSLSLQTRLLSYEILDEEERSFSLLFSLNYIIPKSEL
jgi:hypothetical protein